MYGVLPLIPYADSSPNSNNDVVRFIFTDFSPNVLNCTVLGPLQQPAFHIITDPQMI